MNIAIVVAGGVGKRMGLGYNKVFAKLADEPILCHTIRNFEQCEQINRIIVVAGNDQDGTSELDMLQATALVKEAPFLKVSSIVPGGATRMDSVEEGLLAAHPDDNDIILIQDGGRPFTSPDLISRVIEAAKEYGAAICGCTPKDSVQQQNKAGFTTGTFDRDSLLSVFTPVGARWSLLKKARDKARKESYFHTAGYEDSAFLQKDGVQVRVVQSDYTNMKITTPEDFALGEIILKMRRGGKHS